MVAPLSFARGAPWGVALVAVVLSVGPIGYLMLVAGARYPAGFLALFVVGGVSLVRILVQDRRDRLAGRRRSFSGWQLLVAAVLWAAPAWYVTLIREFGSQAEPAGCNKDVFMACASPAEGGLFLALIFYPFVFMAGWVLMEVLHALRPRMVLDAGRR